MLYGKPGQWSGGQLEWLILYGAWCWPPFFHPAQLWPLPPSSPVYDMAHQMCQGFDEADQKTDRKKPCSTVGFKAAGKETEIPSFYVVDDPELLICKTNARRHAGREKNATMVKGGVGRRGKEQTLISEFIQGQFFLINCSTHHPQSTSNLSCLIFNENTTQHQFCYLCCYGTTFKLKIDHREGAFHFCWEQNKFS